MIKISSIGTYIPKKKISNLSLMNKFNYDKNFIQNTLIYGQNGVGKYTFVKCLLNSIFEKNTIEHIDKLITFINEFNSDGEETSDESREIKTVHTEFLRKNNVLTKSSDGLYRL